MTDKNSSTANSKRIRLITKTITAAIKLWLRTQLSQVSEIKIEIGASDRQLLSGSIPYVSIFATDAVYQGIHVTSIQLAAENIQVNIGGILKGKPLKLLEIVPVVGELIVEQEYLNKSLSSELLSTALNDVLVKFLPEQDINFQSISWHKITLDNQCLTLGAILSTETEKSHLEITAGFKLINTQEIQLAPITIKNNQSLILDNNSGYNLDLGSDTALEEISLESSKLVCKGRVNVNP
jgi:hypothetical protein